MLNRTLILPPLWCGLDRYWAPHAGTLPGSTFKLPFLCPADHVLDLESELGVGAALQEHRSPQTIIAHVVLAMSQLLLV